MPKKPQPSTPKIKTDMKSVTFDTVAAVSTPPGKGGVALIRCSGEHAITVANACFTAKCGKAVGELMPRRATYGTVHQKGAPIDDVLLTVFPAPHSYTGEDIVEIACHGGVLVTRAVLEALLSCGARQAEAGEFTRRAFLNGQLTLTEAEAVGDLLEAKTEGQLKLASVASRKKLRDEFEKLHTAMTELLASVYAVIDFPDEDLAELTDEEIVKRLQTLQQGLTALAASYRTGRAIGVGIPTAIVGRPNVGKSSLYNALCGEDLAIVTATAGTTRDLLHATVQAGRVTLQLTDTAGLRESTDEIERIGIDRAKKAMDEAELLLAVFDLSAPLALQDMDLIEHLAGDRRPIIAVCNKADLAKEAPLPQKIGQLTPHIVRICAAEGDVRELTELIDTLCTDGNLAVGQDAILYDARQFAAVNRALDHVSASLTAFTAGLPADVAFEDLECAVGALAELDGRGVSQEMVDHIFSRFCVGK